VLKGFKTKECEALSCVSSVSCHISEKSQEAADKMIDVVTYICLLLVFSMFTVIW